MKIEAFVILIILSVIGLLIIYKTILLCLRKMGENDKFDKENGHNRFIFKRRYWMPIPLIYIIFICFLPTENTRSNTENNENIIEMPQNTGQTNSSSPTSTLSKCNNCDIGKYDNGICTICGHVSRAKVKDFEQKQLDKINSDPFLKENLKCPVCYGNGCEHCNYKGFILPTDY